jgi:hypothetical protein
MRTGCLRVFRFEEANNSHYYEFFKIKIMKKVFAVTLLISTVSLFSSFTGYKNTKPANVKVTIRIDRLRAISSDACNAKMDFMGKIRLHGGAIKSFPVMEGNNISPGWEVTSPSLPGGKSIPIWIEIWDDDDAVCGGGDDVVIVSTTGSQRLFLRVQPTDWGAKTTTVIGKRVSGKEQAEITYTTTMVAL